MYQADAAKKLAAAFSAAESTFHIPRLIDVNDILSSNIDEHSIMTYVGYSCFVIVKVMFLNSIDTNNLQRLGKPMLFVLLM